MSWAQILGVALILISTMVQGQESDGWDWRITPYLWTVGLDGGLAIGPLSQDIE